MATGQVDRMIGARIRAARVMRGLSQTELGERIGVSFQQVQKYENAANRVSGSRLLAISKVLDVPITYFYEEVEGAEGGEQLSTPAMRAAHILSEMPDGPLKNQIFQLIKAAARKI